MGRYYFVIDLDFDHDDLTVHRFKRKGNDWYPSEPDEHGNFHFALEDRTGFFLNDLSDKEIEVVSAEVEFLVADDHSARNPYQKHSVWNVFEWSLQKSEDSSFRHRHAKQAWFLPGKYEEHGEATNIPVLKQNGTYSKTITIVAKEKGGHGMKTFRYDPTWVVGTGQPIQPRDR